METNSPRWLKSALLNKINSQTQKETHACASLFLYTRFHPTTKHRSSFHIKSSIAQRTPHTLSFEAAEPLPQYVIEAHDNTSFPFRKVAPRMTTLTSAHHLTHHSFESSPFYLPKAPFLIYSFSESRFQFQSNMSSVSVKLVLSFSQTEVKEGLINDKTKINTSLSNAIVTCLRSTLNFYNLIKQFINPQS